MLCREFKVSVTRLCVKGNQPIILATARVDCFGVLCRITFCCQIQRGLVVSGVWSSECGVWIGLDSQFCSLCILSYSRSVKFQPRRAPRVTTSTETLQSPSRLGCSQQIQCMGSLQAHAVAKRRTHHNMRSCILTCSSQIYPSGSGVSPIRTGIAWAAVSCLSPS